MQLLNTISLCMIVKNEETNIARCIAGIISLVDEMIVVDTGSADGTKQIAASLGAKVYDFQWTDSFSDARNFSLSKAKCNWILVIDADELISSMDHACIRELVNGKNQPDAAYSFITRNYVIDPNMVGWRPNDGKYKSEEAGTGWWPNDGIVRLFPNDKRLRYECLVHGTLEPSLKKCGIRIQRVGVPVHHYGFMDEQRTYQKSAYYYNSMKKGEIRTKDYNCEDMYYIALEASQLEKYEESLEWWLRIKQKDPDFPKIHYYLGNTFFHIGKFRRALLSLREAYRIDHNCIETIVMYSQAEICAGCIETSIPPLEKLIEKEPSYVLAIFPLAIAYFCTGRDHEALQYVRKLNDMNFSCAKYFSEFARILMATDRIEYALKVLCSAKQTDNIHIDTFSLIVECEKRLHIQKTDNTTLPVQDTSNIIKKIGRNEPCPCKSGKKYKKCHGK